MSSKDDIRAVLFDFGGTLAYDEPGYAEGFAALCTAMGYPADAQSYHRAGQEAEQVSPEAPRDVERWLLWRESYREELLRRLGVPENEIEHMKRIIAERFRYYSRARCYPETHYVLRSLRWAGYIVGVISNISPGLPLVLKELELDQYLAFAIASDTFGVAKPDPRIFEEGLRRAGVPAEAAMYVGDAIDPDVVGSAAVGMHPVLIDRRGRVPEREGMLRITNLTQLLDRLGVDSWRDKSLHDIVPSR